MNIASRESTIKHAGRREFALTLALLIGLVCFAGCDMGTYNKRLNDTKPSPPNRAAKQMDDAESPAQADN